MSVNFHTPMLACKASLLTVVNHFYKAGLGKQAWHHQPCPTKENLCLAPYTACPHPIPRPNGTDGTVASYFGELQATSVIEHLHG